MCNAAWPAGATWCFMYCCSLGPVDLCCSTADRAPHGAAPAKLVAPARSTSRFDGDLPLPAIDLG